MLIHEMLTREQVIHERGTREQLIHEYARKASIFGSILMMNMKVHACVRVGACVRVHLCLCDCGRVRMLVRAHGVRACNNACAGLRRELQRGAPLPRCRL